MSYLCTCSQLSAASLGTEIPSLNILSSPKHDSICLWKTSYIIIYLPHKASGNWEISSVKAGFAVKAVAAFIMY